MAEPNRGGCPAFDGQLIDLAVQPIAPPPLEAHMATCERCRRAHEQYLDTARIIGAALIIGPDPPAVRRRGVRQIVQILAASALTAAAILLSSTPPESAPPPSGTGLSVHPEAGTTVQLLGPGRASIQSGTSTFVIGNADMVVETPAGRLTCNECEFTIEISECRDCPPSELPDCEPVPICVTLFVAAGLVGSEMPELLVPLGPGEILTWSVPTHPLAALTHLQ